MQHRKRQISLVFLLFFIAKLLHANVLTSLYLLAYVNGKSTNLIIEVFQDKDGEFLISPAELDEIGINIKNLTYYNNDLIDVFCEIGIRTKYLQDAQELHLTVAPHLIKPKILNKQNIKEQQQTNSYADLGSVLNYNFSIVQSGKNFNDLNLSQGISANAQWRLFTNSGIFITNHTGNKLKNTKQTNTRLDTYFSFNDEERLINYRVGDFISSSQNWSNSARLAGIQIKRNFKLRSSLITIPLIPSFAGTAHVPSAVEVYLNKGLYAKYDVEAGPFTIENIPTISGYNSVNIITYDVLGNKTSTQYPFYTSSNQLAKGMNDFAMQLGYARKFYGLENNNYDKRLAKVFDIRYGLNNYVTLEFEAQNTNNFYNAGVGTISNIGNLAILNVAYAQSDYMGITGKMNNIGIEAQLGDVQFYVSSSRSFDEFNNIASVTAQTAKEYLTLANDARGAMLARRNHQLNAGLSIFANTSINLSYAHVKDFNYKKAQLISLNIGQKVGSFTNLSLTFSNNLTEKHSTTLFVGLSIPLGNNINSQISFDKKYRNYNASFDINKGLADQIGSVGWSIRKRINDQHHTTTNMDVSYLSSAARLRLGAAQNKNNSSVNAEIDGSVIAMQDEIIATNHVNDAFAIVDAGAPNIEVRYENRLAGYTQENGKLLLTSLRSYENNKITIDPLNMPLDAKIEITNINVKPKELSGVVADFKVLISNKTALISVIDKDGNYIKAGLVATLNNANTYIVGYDGLLFLDDIENNNTLTIKLTKNTSCNAQFKANLNNLTRTEIYNLICQ